MDRGGHTLNLKRLKFIDKPFLISLIVILGFGLVALTSASQGISGDPYYYVKRQAFFVCLGLVAAILVLSYDYSHLRRYSIIFYGLSVFLLIAVLVIGEEQRGTTGWISLGPLPAIQPAEFTKIMLAVAFADFLNKRKGMLNTLAEILPCLVYMGVPFMLILMQPDLGTALVYIAITIVMLFVAGANPRVLGGLLAVGAGAIALMLFLHFQLGMWLPLEDYQLQRLTVFLNPYEDGQGGRGAGWNIIQSLIAIGSGGLTGQGLFNGTQVQLNFLPEHHTDFIYALIGEEMGFIGAAAIVLLYGILLLRAIHVSFHAKDLYGTLIVAGVAAMWLFHVFENIGMSIGIMPITGIPLPFLSYGGSSMLANFLAVGLVLSVNVRGRKIVF